MSFAVTMDHRILRAYGFASFCVSLRFAWCAFWLKRAAALNSFWNKKACGGKEFLVQRRVV